MFIHNVPSNAQFLNIQKRGGGVKLALGSFLKLPWLQEGELIVRVRLVFLLTGGADFTIVPFNSPHKEYIEKTRI